MQNQKTFPSCTKDLLTNTILISQQTDTCSLIFLPGFDQTSQTHKQLFILPESPSFNNVRTIILQPPLRPITFLGGQEKNNWFDIKHKHQNIGKITQSEIFNLEDVDNQIKRVQEAVDRQIQYWRQMTGKVDYSKIFIAGFAHGGVMSLQYGLSCKQIIGGIACFSGHLLQSTQTRNGNIENTDILLVHGENDTIFTPENTQKSYEKLMGRPNVEWKLIQNIEHRFTRSEVGLLNIWIKNIRKQ